MMVGEKPPWLATPLAKITLTTINVPILKSATVTTAPVSHAICDHQGQLKKTTFPKQRPPVSVEATNVAVRAAVGGDDMLSKWKLMAEQARQKREGGVDVASGSQPGKDVTPKNLSTPTRSSRDNQLAEKKSQLSPILTPSGRQDCMASLKSSIHRSEATKLANGCQTSVVEKSQYLGQANSSPAMQPQSGLASALKTEPEDVAPDHIQASTSEGEGPWVNPLIKEEPDKTNGASLCDHNTEKLADDLSDQPPCSIDANFLQQVVVAFDEAKESQEERARLAKESISMNPCLESTLLAIQEKYRDITKDCPMESGYMLKSVLEVICKVVQELQKKHLTDVNCNLLDSYYLVVKDAEKLKLNVGWLRTRLDEIKDAVKSIVETKKLNDEKNRRVEQLRNEKKDLDAMKAELEKLKSEVERKESLLNLEALVTEELSNTINDRALRIQRFQIKPLMEPFL